MECICVPEYLDLSNMQDLAVFEPPAFNATDELNNPHLTAFIPHQLDDCQGNENDGSGNGSGNGNGNNNHHHHNNQHNNSGEGSIMPPRSSDSLHFPSFVPNPNLQESEKSDKQPAPNEEKNVDRKRKKDNGKGKEREEPNEEDEHNPNDKEEKKLRRKNVPVTSQKSSEKKEGAVENPTVKKHKINGGALFSINLLIVMLLALISVLALRKVSEF